MTDIRPRMVDGVGWCRTNVPCVTLKKLGCDESGWSCVVDGRDHTDSICPVWASRMAAWAEEARDLLELDPDAHPDAADLLSRYPGKDGK